MAKTEPNRPKRLLFIQTQAEAGGAQEITRILGEELTRPNSAGMVAFEQHHVFLYRKSNGCDHFPNVQFAADPRPSGVFDNIRMLRRLYSIVREIKPDVMLTFQHYGNIVAAPIGRLAGVPLIIANHVSPQCTISRPVAIADLVLGMAGFYDEITVNSHATMKDYQAYPERYKRQITYVPHGFADKTTTLTKAEARARFNIPLNVPLMGSVARLHPIKRLHLAIQLLPELPHAHLALAGQGPEEQELRDLARQLGVADRLHLVGEMPSSDVGKFLAALDVFVFPSSSETFGLAPVEAAQAGIPVISTDLPIMHEVLQVKGTPAALFVDATDTKAMAGLVQKVLSDDALYQKLSSLGRQMKSEHTLDGMIEGYRALISRRNQVAESGVQALA